MQFKHLFLTITFLLNVLLISFAQEPTLLEHGGGVRTVEFSPVDASLLATAGESNLIKLWNLQSDTVQTLRGHTAVVNSIAFSPNGELLASVSSDRTLRLWSVQNQQNIAMRNITDRYQSITFSPDGELLATGGGRHLKLWNVRNRTEVATLPHNQDVRTVAFSPDGRLLAAGDGSGNGPGIVKVWDVKKRQVVVSLEANPKNVKAVEFSSDNRYLAGSGWNGHLKIWDVSNWGLLRTIPNIGHYDIAFSPDSKMITSTNNGYVSLWWVEDGARVAQLPGPTDWIHPIDFSHDGNSLAVGAEDGVVRIWRINASLTDDGSDGVRILHVDNYLQQLPKSRSANGDNIPEPIPPPVVVRDFFELDPFYEQWIDVGGMPVVASAKVNPYAVKEAAWLIGKMIGHRPDVLHAMVVNKVRFVVIGYTEMTTQIPEYSDLRPAFYYNRRVRGLAGHPAVSCTEENLLDYPGDTAPNGYQLIHEFSHIVHLTGLRTVDPGFDNRLRTEYEAAMRKGLWRGTYAASDRYEYWAEGTNAWIDPKGGSSFKSIHGGNTRQALKQYDPGLSTLLIEVYGDNEWRYSPIVTRTHLPHLQGFNPQDSPTFKWPEELEETYAQLRDPNIDNGDEWVNLNPYKPSQLSHLNKSGAKSTRTHILFVNLAEIDVLIYQVYPDGTETFIKRIPAKRGFRHAEKFDSRVGDVYLIKDQGGKKLIVFQAEEKTGRALIGASANKTSHAAQGDVSRNASQPQVLIAQSQRPPMYWMDSGAGTIHRLVGAKVENLVPNVQNVTSLAIDSVNNKLYWAARTDKQNWGKLYRGDLDGRNIEELRKFNGLPLDLVVDAARQRLYWTDVSGRIQRADLGANHIQNLVRDLPNPMNAALAIGGNKLYWAVKTEGNWGKLYRGGLDGRNVEELRELNGLPLDLVVDVQRSRLYWIDVYNRIQRADLEVKHIQNVIRDLEGLKSLALDVPGGKLYWTEGGNLRRASLDGENIEDVVTGLGTPRGIALGVLPSQGAAAAPSAGVVSPDRSQLLTNYPNPFNPETWIPYQLSKPAEVTLRIYAVNGTLIRTLALGHQPAGVYHSRTRAAYWDGKNEVGESVASGVYFYTLSAGDFTSTRKMFIRK